MYIAFILQCKKSPKQLPNCLKRAETSIVIIVFNGVLCDVSTYTVTASYHRSTWIGYQKKLLLGQWQYIAKMYPINAILTAHIEQVKDKTKYITITLWLVATNGSYSCCYGYNWKKMLKAIWKKSINHTDFKLRLTFWGILIIIPKAGLSVPGTFTQKWSLVPDFKEFCIRYSWILFKFK